MAATKFVEELSKRALGRYSIIVIGAEPRRVYNRVLLSSLLAREVEAEKIELKPLAWWERNGVTNLFGRKVASIDPATHSLPSKTARDSITRSWCSPRSDPIRLLRPGMDLPGVITFRWVEDVDQMLGGIKS